MMEKLLRRLDRLENRIAEDLVLLVFCPPYYDPATLAPNERIVDDWYERQGPIVSARQRITTDPKDHGRRCPAPIGCLEDVNAEVDAYLEGWKEARRGE